MCCPVGSPEDTSEWHWWLAKTWWSNSNVQGGFQGHSLVWLGEVQNISGKLMFIPPKYNIIIFIYKIIFYCYYFYSIMIMIIVIVMDFNSSPRVFEPGNPSYSKNSTVKPSVKLPSLLLLGLRCAGISGFGAAGAVENWDLRLHFIHLIPSTCPMSDAVFSPGFNVQLPSFDWLHLEMICPTLFVMRCDENITGTVQQCI